MRFAGRVYFDFASVDTWHLYRFLAACAGSGVELALSWEPFLDEEDPVRLRALATYAAVQGADRDRHGLFLQALLTLHHRDGAELDDDSTYAAAASAAGIDVAAMTDAAGFEPGVRLSTADARELGVVAVPTLYRHGPVMHVRLNPAALDGDVTARLRVIDAALDDDGIWALVKP
jgi:hypothetical protein